MDIVKEKEKLFDDDFNVRPEHSNEELLAFCNELTKKSTILCSTKSGKMYEYLPEIYKSVVKVDADEM